MSDCRMSGTAFGTIILHCCPESAVGGNLGLVENGDEIELDTAGRRLHLHVADEVRIPDCSQSNLHTNLKSGPGACTAQSQVGTAAET